MLKTDRRKFMALLDGAATSLICSPLPVNAQSRLPVIGWINMRPVLASVPPYDLWMD
jgi:hypothetical protein